MDRLDGLSHNPVNRRLLAHVAIRSAHGDLVERLQAAVAHLGDVQLHCNNPDRYEAVVVSTLGIAFGLAVGMDTIAFRLSPAMRERALLTGGAIYPDAGEDWLGFGHVFASDWPDHDLQFWATRAYLHARGDRH